MEPHHIVLLVAMMLGTGTAILAVPKMVEDSRDLRLDLDAEQTGTFDDAAEVTSERFSSGLGGPTQDLPLRFQRYFLEDRRRASERSQSQLDKVAENVITTNATWGDARPGGLEKQDMRGLKLVLGIMSYTAHREIRDAHRKTWMGNPGVCSVRDHEKDDCHVFPIFIFGNVSKDDVEEADDTLILSEVQEPKNKTSGFKGNKSFDMWFSSQLKTPAFFRYAQQGFPWASHVGKMDLDTYPLMDRVQDLCSRAPEKFLIGHQLRRGGFAGRYGMYGALYIITADLLPCWIDSEKQHRDAKGNKWHTYAEDQVFAYLLSESDDPLCETLQHASSDYRKSPLYYHPVR